MGTGHRGLRRGNRRRPACALSQCRNQPWEEGLAPAEHFACAQSVFVDDEDTPWILDSGKIKNGGDTLLVSYATVDGHKAKLTFRAPCDQPSKEYTPRNQRPNQGITIFFV